MATFCLACLAAPFLLRLRARSTVRLVAALAFALGLAGAIGVSTAHAPSWVRWAALVAIVAVGYGSREGWVRAWRSPASRDALAAWAMVAVGLVAFAVSATHYSGGAWGSDFQEHYERAEYFAGRRAIGPTASDLAARPPIANAALGFSMALLPGGFALWAVDAALLASLLVVPVAALARRFARGRPVARYVALAFVASPVLMQTSVYPWTKAGAAFGVLAGLYLGTRGRWALAGLALAVGGGVHQSALVYALALAGWALVRRPAGGLRASTAFLAALAPVALWTLAVGSLAASPAVSGVIAEGAGGALARVAANLWTTIVPHPLRMDAAEFGRWFGQTSALGALRDWFFCLYQSNAFAVFGLAGVFALVGASREGRRALPLLALAALGVLGGAVLDPYTVPWGNANVTAPAAVALAVAFAASRLADSSGLERALWLAALAVDLAAGVLLQAWCESVDPAVLSRQAAINARAMGEHGWSLAGVGPWLVGAVGVGWLALATGWGLAPARRAATGRGVAERARAVELAVLDVDLDG